MSAPLAICAAASSAQAADPISERHAVWQIADQVSAELFGGYLTGMSRELVYNVPGDGSKLSQLNWQIDHAFVLGGALGYRPWNWLELRARGWAHVSSDNAMDDFDWLFGFNGFDSWSDLSHHDDTRLAKAFQVDVSAAARVFKSGPLSVSALGGYRFLTMKWNAYGGRFVYSTDDFRDDIGTFPDRELQIAYQQWWHAPYLGLGLTYRSGPLTVATELIGTPLVRGRDQDHHVEIALFKENFSPSRMAGMSVSAELAMNRHLSLVGRVEAERFYEAKGSTTVFGFDPPGIEFFPKPSAGADHQSLLVSLGAKGRF
ncbi:MAG TPA: omptin family outer membrane protease [Beijerinckiaceae bacterium]|nr:omptin family outer membrane protease [Beijerinckiaceae bacterium]